MAPQTAENEPKISIIVPIYKVERYLRECLDSILAQTFGDWECILVDDGSPDGCPQICDEYAARDPRFRVIHRANGGVAAARNSGLRAARGEYIGFVDPDDWIAPQLFERLLRLITEYGTDMVQVGFWKEYAGYSTPKPLVESIRVLGRKEIVRELVFDKRIQSYLWNKLFRRKTINPDFSEGRVFEDMAILNHWVRDIRSAVLAPDLLYHYRMRKGSIIHSDFSANQLDYFKACREREQKTCPLEPEALSEEERARFLWKIAIRSVKNIARKEPDSESRMRSAKAIIAVCQEFPPPAIGWLGLKKYLRARLLLNHPALFIRLMRAMAAVNLDGKYRKGHLYD